ncbi:MAG: hypothetical protein JWP44_4522 [Mucilaginibacter sp.]|nr:hypothetical protein [Mucilaginibacter sp.]
MAAKFYIEGNDQNGYVIKSNGHPVAEIRHSDPEQADFVWGAQGLVNMSVTQATGIANLLNIGLWVATLYVATTCAECPAVVTRAHAIGSPDCTGRGYRTQQGFLFRNGRVLCKDCARKDRQRAQSAA